MKFTSLVSVACMAAVLAVGSVGCKKKPTGVTNLPYGGGTGPSTSGNAGRGNPFGQGTPITTIDPLAGTGISDGDASSLTGNRNIDDPNRPRNTEKFASETVYFALDKAIVEQKELGKIGIVADFLKQNPSHDVLVEGHCDERGTEGYNLALGDRRALAIREAMIAAGAPADNIHTVSFGESRPADTGHSESAWAKNRRGVFILVEPATK